MNNQNWHDNKTGKFYGLGAAKMGTHHWWVQRLTAIALVPLSIWLVISFLYLIELNYIDTKEWFDQPYNQALLVLWIAVAIWHAILGIQVVIEDYVHKPAMHYMLRIATNFILTFLGVVGIIYVLRF